MLYLLFIFFFKQKTAYEMRISDWSSDVCSSDLACKATALPAELRPRNLCSEQRLWWAEEDLNLRSEERRVGKSVSVRVDLGGRRIIKKKKKEKEKITETNSQHNNTCQNTYAHTR